MSDTARKRHTTLTLVEFKRRVAYHWPPRAIANAVPIYPLISQLSLPLNMLPNTNGIYQPRHEAYLGDPWLSLNSDYLRVAYNLNSGFAWTTTRDRGSWNRWCRSVHHRLSPETLQQLGLTPAQ